MELRHDPTDNFDAHIAEARRVLALPVEVSGLHWHPFGVYAIPLAKRRDRNSDSWSRRLHIWHPDGTPVGESSPYGVHTHSGTARSHVLVGELTHHLYHFKADPEGTWNRAMLGVPQGNESLVAHATGQTGAEVTHTFEKDTPHGVTKDTGTWALSLFEQRGDQKEQDFTTWQRSDIPAEPLLRQGPAPTRAVQQLALSWLDALD